MFLIFFFAICLKNIEERTQAFKLDIGLAKRDPIIADSISPRPVIFFKFSSPPHIEMTMWEFAIISYFPLTKIVAPVFSFNFIARFIKSFCVKSASLESTPVKVFPLTK